MHKCTFIWVKNLGTSVHDRLWLLHKTLCTDWHTDFELHLIRETEKLHYSTRLAKLLPDPHVNYPPWMRCLILRHTFNMCLLHYLKVWTSSYSTCSSLRALIQTRQKNLSVGSSHSGNNTWDNYSKGRVVDFFCLIFTHLIPLLSHKGLWQWPDHSLYGDLCMNYKEYMK